MASPRLPVTDPRFDYSQLNHAIIDNAADTNAQDASVQLDNDRPPSRSGTGGWKACSFILAVEIFERFSHHGISSNLITYLTTVLHESTASAAKKVNNFQGTNAVLPVIGAFIADAYWGKYRTSIVASVFYVLGLLFLTISVSLPTLRPPMCQDNSFTCPKATPAQLGFFYFSLYLTSIGIGGTQPCFEAFGADQFDEDKLSTRTLKSSFFNWWYFALSVASLFASTLLIYIQDNLGWGLGFGIPAATMTSALCFFIAGTPFYVHKLPGGSPITRMAQVLVAAIQKWDLKVPSDKNLLYEMPSEELLGAGRKRLLHTQQFVCLDKAATYDSSVYVRSSAHKSSTRLCNTASQNGDGNLTLRLLEEAPSNKCSCNKMQRLPVSPWKLCTVTQVEEVKLVLRILPVILATLIYGVAHAQATTLFTKQGSTMRTNIGPSFKISPASLQVFTSIICLLTLPLYDRILVPAARQITGNERGITLLQRIGVGLFLTIMCMIIAAFTEMKRLKVAKDNGLLDNPTIPLPMSIFWLIPQYLLIGISNVFTIVGKQEFFYDQVPDTMRSLGMAVYLLTSGAGGFLSSLLITIVNRFTSRGGNESWFVDNINRCHIDYFYWLLAVMSSVNFFVYIGVAWSFTYKRVESAIEPASDPAKIHQCSRCQPKRACTSFLE